MIQPSNVFKDNLAQLPAIDGIERIDLVDGKGAVVDGKYLYFYLERV